jgi:hypothetical protein
MFYIIPTALLGCHHTHHDHLIHLTVERPTKGGFADVSHNIARLVQAISLKLQESNVLLYTNNATE